MIKTRTSDSRDLKSISFYVQYLREAAEVFWISP